MPVPTMAPTPSAIRCGQLSVLAKDWLASCDRMSSSDLRGPNIRFSPFVAGSGRDFELCFQIVERRLDMLGQQMLEGKIGRASARARVCQSRSTSEVAASIKKKK